mmetsp:Transcript_13580/g.18605  ORF Transcript_13580/g.18605 Transcript_13580/m.18605 type:complete len:86 (+) Transcript_13580:2-259(+)
MIELDDKNTQMDEKKRMDEEKAMELSKQVMDPQSFEANKAFMEAEFMEKLTSLQREKLMLHDFIGAKKKGLLSPKSSRRLLEECM